MASDTAPPSWATATAARFRPPPLPPGPIELMRNANMEPDLWQATFLEDRPRRALLLCSRQSGKSTVVAASALHEATAKKDATILLLAPSQRQAILLLRKVRQFALAQQPAIPMERRSEMSLRLKNGSLIVGLPAKDGTIRGFSAVDLIVIDEAAEVPGTLAEAVRPMLAVSNGRLVCMGTPKGKRGWFYEAWTASQAGSTQWESTIRITAPECSRISPEFLAEEKATLSAAVFAQEYFCSFEEAQGAVFSAATIERMHNDDIPELDLWGDDDDDEGSV
jgi:hypothetical protein